MKTMKPIRVRFAPSPTGGLHIGGVRTLIYNYLFAQKYKGQFILRIEDTDKKRHTHNAETYILNVLKWLRIPLDEGPDLGGKFAPYRQSERKYIYRQYAMELIQKGYAYYAFDTPEELNDMRNRSDKKTTIQYDKNTRMKMHNSLTVGLTESEALIAKGIPYVVRLKVPENETIICEDRLRGSISFQSNVLDDKILYKSDGLPTYHLASVVDDYLMQISHIFRGEEWLPSTPIHILLWKFLGWERNMPQWIHLPLLLKPEGNGKLSKRDAEQLGMPIFPIIWQDPRTGSITKGFKEAGFLPEALINTLTLLSWNDGTGKEIFSVPELIEKFSLDRIHPQSVKFDYEKAKWINTQHLRSLPEKDLLHIIKNILHEKNIPAPDDAHLYEIIKETKERYTLLTDIWEHIFYFFEAIQSYDTDSLTGKWDTQKAIIFQSVTDALTVSENPPSLETIIKETATSNNIKLGTLQLPLRIMLVGAKKGINIFTIAHLLGKHITLKRIQKGVTFFNKYFNIAP